MLRPFQYNQITAMKPTIPSRRIAGRAWIVALIIIGLGILTYSLWPFSNLRGDRIKIPKHLVLENFQRPSDRDISKQLVALEQTAVAQFIAANALKPFLDDVNTSQLQLNGIELRAGQFPKRPELLGIVNDCARILGVPKPRVFVVNDLRTMAATVNFKDPIILLNAMMLDQGIDSSELRFVIGREMGHIRCGHVQFLVTIRALVEGSQKSPLLPQSVVLAPMLPALKWAREAAMSADNAGLLCCQDRSAAEQSLIRSIYRNSQGGKIDVDAYLAQKATQPISDFANAAIFWREAISEQPFVPDRVQQLREYEKSVTYQRVWK